jgi:hypothetical protein
VAFEKSIFGAGPSEAKSNEADYFVCRCRRRISLVVESCEAAYPNDGSFATLAAIRLASSRQHAAVPGRRMSAARANLPT